MVTGTTKNQKGGERKIKWEKISLRITMIKRRNKFGKYLEKRFLDCLSTALFWKSTADGM